MMSIPALIILIHDNNGKSKTLNGKMEVRKVCSTSNFLYNFVIEKYSILVLMNCCSVNHHGWLKKGHNFNVSKRNNVKMST